MRPVDYVRKRASNVVVAGGLAGMAYAFGSAIINSIYVHTRGNLLFDNCAEGAYAFALGTLAISLSPLIYVGKDERDVRFERKLKGIRKRRQKNRNI